MRLFLDSSALAKRYIAEHGTDLVLERCGEADEVVLSVLCIPEVISGLNRLRRQNKLSNREYAKMKRDLAADVAEGSLIDLTEGVIQEAIRCLERTHVRAMDAIHIASAIESVCDLFLSADTHQCKAARLAGVPVEEIAP